MADKTRDIVTVLTHNMTEGDIQLQHRIADVLLLTETDHDKVSKGLGKDFRVWTPDRDPHQAIAWAKDKWTLIEEPRSVKLHGSGAGDDRIPDAIRTPARFKHEVTLRNDLTGVVVVFAVVWVINSWNPYRKDRWTKIRRWIAEQLTFVKIIKHIKKQREKGREYLLGGDLNSVKASYSWAGMDFAPRRGLDRFVWTVVTGALKMIGKPRHGLETGVGNDMKHKALIATFAIKKQRNTDQSDDRLAPEYRLPERAPAEVGQ